MVSTAQAARVATRFPVDVARARRGEPSTPTTYLAVRRAHVLTGGHSTALLARLARSLPGRADTVDPEHLALVNSRWVAQAQALAADGACNVPDAFTPEEVAELMAFAVDGPATLTHVDGSASSGTYRDRGPDVVAVRLHQSFLLTRPAVQAMLARGMAAQVATARDRVWPTAHPPLLYWSCTTTTRPNADVAARLARSWHSDFDGLAGLRLHVYLTDVTDGTAPMDYVAGSHRPGAVPRSLRQDVTDPIADAEVSTRFPTTALRRFVGSAGTSFMTDSNGLHRGNSPTDADRLFLVMGLQAGALAGAYNRVRRLPVVDDAFAAALHRRRPDLRLFEPAPPGGSVAASFTT